MKQNNSYVEAINIRSYIEKELAKLPKKPTKLADIAKFKRLNHYHRLAIKNVRREQYYDEIYFKARIRMLTSLD